MVDEKLIDVHVREDHHGDDNGDIENREENVISSLTVVEFNQAMESQLVISGERILTYML